ncbi:transposase [Corynebacterium choanae]
MDPFHVVHLALDKLTKTRQRVQQETTGHRGRKGDLLYRGRRPLLTRVPLLSAKQLTVLEELFADERHQSVEITWSVTQKIMAAYSQRDRKRGKQMMAEVIDSIASGVPKGLDELRVLGRTMNKRRDDILAYFDYEICKRPR